MKVEKVSATIRYSQDTGKGAWKVIEIGAEGTVDTRENWQAAQAYLYAELGKQLKTLWHNGNGAALNGAGGAESHVEPQSTGRELATWNSLVGVTVGQVPPPDSWERK